MHASIHAPTNGSRLIPPSCLAPSVRSFQGLAESALKVTAEPDAEIFAQGDEANYCFIVISGCVRTATLMEDGRRQVGGFYLPGDVFGWDVMGEYDMSAEAVTDVVLGRIPMRNLEQMADRDPLFARGLRRLGAEQLRQARERMIMLGRMTALERIASFLSDMVSRGGQLGQATVALPMSRADIADHLGLTVETVCRGLAQLRRTGAIALERHGFRVLNRSGLASAREASVH